MDKLYATVARGVGFADAISATPGVEVAAGVPEATDGDDVVVGVVVGVTVDVAVGVTVADMLGVVVGVRVGAVVGVLTCKKGAASAEPPGCDNTINSTAMPNTTIRDITNDRSPKRASRGLLLTIIGRPIQPANDGYMTDERLS